MATITTLTSDKAWHPDITAIAPQTAAAQALILQVTTVAGQVEGDDVAVRVPYAGDDDANLVAEGEPIAEGNPPLAETLIWTTKVAKLIRPSREQFGQPNAAALLSDEVSRSITRRADLAFLQQPAPAVGTNTPPPGLLNIDGIVDGGAISGSLDGLIDIQTAVAANDAVPTHWLLAPSAWSQLRKLKRQTGSAESLLGVGAQDAVPFLLDVPVVVTNALPADTGMLVDKTAIISAVGSVQVAQSADAYFASDSIGVRATWRIGANAVRPQRIAKFTVAAA